MCARAYCFHYRTASWDGLYAAAPTTFENRERKVKRYCVCMNDKMDENETRSVSQWEKANLKTAEAFSRQAWLELDGESGR